MLCSACRHENRPDARFCSGYGQCLSAVCAACGSSNAPDGRLCDACSLALAGRPPSREQHASPQAYPPAHLAPKILTTRTAGEGERVTQRVHGRKRVASGDLVQGAQADS